MIRKKIIKSTFFMLTIGNLFFAKNELRASSEEKIELQNSLSLNKLKESFNMGFSNNPKELNMLFVDAASNNNKVE